MAKVPKHLMEKIKTIPEKPGIYKMKDMDGNVMYIGKSKTLQSRVRSYFYADHKQNKIKQMVIHIHDIDIIITDTHLEAQLLECSLIKNMKPIYNKQFKNDNNYVYLMLGNDSLTKPLSIVRDRYNEYCIGPYRGKNRLQEAISIFQNIFPITKCGQRYQFQYNILPCSLEQEAFEGNKECLKEVFFQDECMIIFLSEIEKKMEEASLKLQYERASYYRDLIEHMKYINHNATPRSEFEDRDILMGEQIEDGYKIFYISNNQMILKRKYRELNSDSLENFLRQAQALSLRGKSNIDEKRELDFKKIISAELQDSKTKRIAFIDREYSIDQFLNSLL